MSESFTEYDNFIHQEMLVHTALFTHQKAVNIAIIGNHHIEGILAEVLKHASVRAVWQISPTAVASHSQDPRFQIYAGTQMDWLASVKPESFDVIIIPEKTTPLPPMIYQQYLNTLQSDGILIQQCESLFNLLHLKVIFQAMKSAGFNDTQIVHFPQPSFPSGWFAATMAHKQGLFKRLREKEIYNKPFITRYYNFDVHKAALVLPEFMREELSL